MTRVRDRRPVVGVVGHSMVVRRPFGELPVSGTSRAYVNALASAGLRPVLLPGAHALDLLDLVDALVLTGGGDIDPALSGVEPSEAADVDRSRDDAEIAVVHAAREGRIPLLGCCRGLQVLAVAFGGKLHPVKGHVEPGPGHEVMTEPGSQVARLLGASSRTSALHRQAVADPGTFWRATAWADGTVEAIEPAAADDWAVLGVQWHPELSGVDPFTDETGPALFRWLASEAARRPAAAGPGR